MSTCPNCGEAYKPGEEVCPSCGALLPLSDGRLAPGALLQGRYEVMELTHAGSMGYIYTAKDRKLFGKPCIVKQVKEPVGDKEDLSKLEWEAERMSQPGRPDGAAVTDHFVEGGYYFIVQAVEHTVPSADGMLTEKKAVTRARTVDAVPVKKAGSRRRAVVLAIGIVAVAGLAAAAVMAAVNNRPGKPAAESQGKPAQAAVAPAIKRPTVPKEADWPLPGRDPGFTRYTPDAPPEKLNVIWEKEQDFPYGTLLVSGNNLVIIPTYTNTGLKKLGCMDAATGQLMWQREVDDFGGNAWKSSANRDSIFFDGGNHIYCMDINTGKTVWDRSPSADSTTARSTDTTLIPIDGKLYYADHYGVYCVDAFTGAKLWETGNYFAISGVGYLVSDGESVFAAHNMDRVSAIDGDTGRTLWQYGISKSNYRYDSLIAGGGKLYVFCTSVSNDTFERVVIVCLDGKTGQVAWQQDTEGYPVMARSALGKGMLVVPGNEHVSCFDASTGKLMWKNSIDLTEGGRICGTMSAVIAGGVVMGQLGDDEGCKYAYWDINTGKAVSLFKGGIWNPVLANGRFYDRSYSGKFICVGD